MTALVRAAAILPWFLVNPLLVHSQHPDPINVRAVGYLEWVAGNDRSEDYAQNSFDLTVRKNSWTAEFSWQLSLPEQTLPYRHEQKVTFNPYLETRRSWGRVRVGAVDAMLGRGLTLRAFENRKSHWNNQVTGGIVTVDNGSWSARVLAGFPRTLEAEYGNGIGAGEFKLKPVDGFAFGSTYAQSTLPTFGTTRWGSLFSEVHFEIPALAKNAVAYIEYARSTSDSAANGTGLYASACFSAGPVSILADYKDYRDFDLTDEAVYNAPPAVAKEHAFQLPGRTQLVLNPDDEVGYLVEAQIPLTENRILTLDYNFVRSHRPINLEDKDLYQEVYAQLDATEPGDWTLNWGAGYQEDFDGKYSNLLNRTTWPVGPRNAVIARYEFQRAEIKITDRKFHTHLASLGLSRSASWEISVVAEYTTDQVSETSFWIGSLFEIEFRRYHIILFAGTRRAERTCAGRICGARPELEGVELIVTARL